jgi:hypothetical protein
MTTDDRPTRTLQVPRPARMTLEQAARHAATLSEPLRLRHDDGELFAEVYMFRDQILHAHANGLDGIRAFAALLLCNLSYAQVSGVWPARCTIIAPWAVACREAELIRRRPPVRQWNDDEATERLD